MGLVQRDSFHITLISYAGAVIGYLNKIFLFTNFLSTEQVGLANLMITISVLYAQVAALGSYNITVRFFPFFNERKDGQFGFHTALIAWAMAGFIIATALFLFVNKPFIFFYSDSGPLLVEYSLYIIPLAMASLYYQLFESYLRSLRKNLVPTILHELGARLFVTASILIFAMGYISFPAFVLIYVAANCLPALLIIGYTVLIKQFVIKPALTPLFRRLGKIMLVYGLFSMFNNLSIMLLGSIDALMVAGMIDLGSAGIYTTMIFITSVMLIPYRSMLKVSGPIVADYWKTRSMGKMEVLYKKATASNLVVGGGIFLLIWVNLDAVFALMPGAYETGKMVFLLLGMGKLFDMATGLNGTILLMSKKFRYDLFFTMGLVVFAVITNMLFIPILGMNGAALASMLTIMAFNAIRILFIRHLFKIQPFEWKQCFVPILIALIMVLSSTTGQIINLYVDVPVRSLIAGLLFLLPVMWLKISPDLNQMIQSGIQLITPESKHPGN